MNDVLQVGLGKRALVVDDSEIVRTIAAGICQKLGFAEIVEAEDGGRALEILKSDDHFAVVVSDWNMEPVAGIDLLTQVRSIERLERTRFVMMTARRDHESVIAAKKAGVDGYILKPFSVDAFAEKLRLAFKARRQASA